LSLAKLFSRVNGNLLALFTHTLKLDATVNQSKQSIVAADPYILTGMNVSASLANQDVAGQYSLTVSTLYAQTLGL